MSIISAGGAVVGAGGPTQYQIERSLRFNSADSAYLNRTFGAGNQKTWTLSAWVKRSALGDNQIFSNYTSGTDVAWIYFNSSNELYFQNFEGSNQLELKTTQVFRDVGAWGHLVVNLDTTQATSSNRAKLYWNGVQITTLTTATYPSQNADLKINTNTEVHELGRASTTYFNGYLTEINFIDGSALDPTSFGEFNSTTGVWQPKAYTGSYGTNGFYLNFSDNASTTTLGDDLSGNGNDWTTNNFSVTAGAGNDSLVDTPTNYGTDTGVGGEVRGNYTTWNALDRNSSGTLANGNLDWTSGTTAHYGVRGTMSPPSGKWYFEVTASAATSATIAYGIGMANAANPLNQGAQSNTGAYLLYGVGTSLELEAAGVQGSTISGGASIGTNDVIQVAYDVDASKMWVGKNNTYYDSSGGSTGDPGTGANPSFSSLLANLFPFVEVYNSTVYANFGQRPFAYTAPSGFKALCTQNLPEPTIVDGSEYFNTILYTGTGSSNARTGVGFQPDWVWIKERNAAADHGLYDAVRGVQNQLESNTTTAETAEATGLTAFGTDGFTVGALAQLNTSGDTYVAWNWKANGAGVSNTAGTITSTVSVNTTSGFSIVTYTGTGANATVGHGLGAVPRMIIVKNRDQADAWQVYHAANTANPETDYLVLNTTAATADAADRWNDTLPTSTVFSIGNGVEVNTNTEDYVAYVFAAIPGYSAFGSYTGNGSTDGPFIYTGFRPRWIMVKQTNASGDNWAMYDTSRSPYNICGNILFANLSDAENSGGGNNSLDILSNGFKWKTSLYNGSGSTYIYAAFAENPFKYSLAR